MITAAATALIFPRDRGGVGWGASEENVGPTALKLALPPPPPTLTAEKRLLEEQGGEGSLAWGSSPTLSSKVKFKHIITGGKKGIWYTSGGVEENTWGMQLQRKRS